MTKVIKIVETSRYQGGRRKELNNIYFRSRWEANYARYLNFLNVKWRHEPKMFYFPGIRRGNVSYMPDFYLPDEDRWVEVKGYLDQPSRTKLKRFKKYYPEQFAKLTIVIRDPWAESKSAIEAMKFLEKLGLPPEAIEGYKEIEDKFGGLIAGWE